MKSYTLDSFWRLYEKLDSRVKAQAKKAFMLWEENPFHTSLNFKCVNAAEDVWSVRVSKKYRALGILQDNKVFWFWVGKHDDYECFIGK